MCYDLNVHFQGRRVKIVHYCVHKNWPLVPNLNQINLTHVLSFYFFKLRFNIIIPSKPSLPSGLLPSSFPVTKLCALFLSHTWYTTHPSHSRNTNYEEKLRFAVPRDLLPGTQNGLHICKLVSDFIIYNGIWLKKIFY